MLDSSNQLIGRTFFCLVCAPTCRKICGRAHVGVPQRRIFARYLKSATEATSQVEEVSCKIFTKSSLVESITSKKLKLCITAWHRYSIYGPRASISEERSRISSLSTKSTT
ncbi:hypothetical protein CEXT_680031 [Caerostris extrusa]|uniref:Uncharacterized protein n=1 Tax=Caerostris extrusa TaxID=172846 RepID=A0AAV4Y3K0_CAEEX|nr:hypothetical protein CEXT_680031 [Caerostris extrusa]